MVAPGERGTQPAGGETRGKAEDRRLETWKRALRIRSVNFNGTKLHILFWPVHSIRNVHVCICLHSSELWLCFFCLKTVLREQGMR